MNNHLRTIILDAMPEDRWMTSTQLATELGADRATTTEYLEQLADHELVETSVQVVPGSKTGWTQAVYRRRG